MEPDSDTVTTSGQHSPVKANGGLPRKSTQDAFHGRPPFYSALLQAVEQSRQASASTPQWLRGAYRNSILVGDGMAEQPRIQKWREVAALLKEGWQMEGQFGLVGPNGERRSVWGNAPFELARIVGSPPL